MVNYGFGCNSYHEVLGELAVKRAHGGHIAKLKLIKNRGQIMPSIFNYF